MNEFEEFYVHGSVNCISILIIVQRDATQSSLFYSASSLYVFRVSTTPITRSTQNCNYSLRYWSSYLPPTWPNLATVEGGSCTKSMTVLCTPGDGRGWNPKHVEWTCRIINRLLCVVSRWTVISIIWNSTNLYLFWSMLSILSLSGISRSV